MKAYVLTQTVELDVPDQQFPIRPVEDQVVMVCFDIKEIKTYLKNFCTFIKDDAAKNHYNFNTFIPEDSDQKAALSHEGAILVLKGAPIEEELKEDQKGIPETIIMKALVRDSEDTVYQNKINIFVAGLHPIKNTYLSDKNETETYNELVNFANEL